MESKNYLLCMTPYLPVLLPHPLYLYPRLDDCLHLHLEYLPV